MSGTENLVLREANPNDVDGIWTLMKELLEYHNFPIDVADRKEILKNGFDKPALYRCYMAEVNQKLAGFALTYPGFAMQGRVLYLECLYIRNEYRNLKIGLKLMKLVAQEAVQLNCILMRFVVINWNQARKFYERLGAKNETQLYGFEGYYMERNEIENLLLDSKL